MKLTGSKLFLADLLLLALFALAARGRAQTSPLLSLQAIQITTGGPVEFTFSDQGTGLPIIRLSFPRL